jgi:hypothetical protein
MIVFESEIFWTVIVVVPIVLVVSFLNKMQLIMGGRSEEGESLASGETRLFCNYRSDHIISGP